MTEDKLMKRLDQIDRKIMNYQRKVDVNMKRI
jgi:hypothetical protein